MTKMYICNKATSKCPDWCKHGKPHPIYHYEADMGEDVDDCTAPDTCDYGRVYCVPHTDLSDMEELFDI